MKNNTKWIIIGIAAIVLLVIASAIGSNKQNTPPKDSEDVEVIVSNAEKESEKASQEDLQDFPEIKMDQYLEYYNGEEGKIVLLARPTCHYCQIAEPIIKKIAQDYNLNIEYLNTDNFSEEDNSKLMNSDEFFKEGYGTPILLIVGQSKIINKVDGLTDTAHYIKFFKENGFIK